MKSRRQAIIFCTLWGAALIIGFTYLSSYAARPGSVGLTHSQWPSKSTLVLAQDRPTLLVFAHPECPCTLATASELQRVLARVETYPVAVYVLMYTPDFLPLEWSGSSLKKRFETMAGVTVIADHNGKEAELFGALTSGQTYLYSPLGELVFHGGLTPSRGHEGDNPGKDAVISYIIGKGARDPMISSVFGCALKGEPNGE